MFETEQTVLLVHIFKSDWILITKDISENLLMNILNNIYLIRKKWTIYSLIFYYLNLSMYYYRLVVL